jgi:hypothetical protein
MGGDHRIAGPESLTGDELVARVSAGLGQTIRYSGQSVSDFEREVVAAMGAGAGRRIASKFRYFATYPEEAEVILARPFTPQSGLEDFRPQSVEAWVQAHRLSFTMPSA